MVRRDLYRGWRLPPHGCKYPLIHLSLNLLTPNLHNNLTVRRDLYRGWRLQPHGCKRLLINFSLKLRAASNGPEAGYTLNGKNWLLQTQIENIISQNKP
jgi:hypothetical protein